MKRKSLGGHMTVKSYVQTKLNDMPQNGFSFRKLFDMMFSERENIMFEKSDGYRIIETTYGECYQSVLKKADALYKQFQNLPPQSVIGLYMESGREWIEAFWAILLSGFCPLLMNLRLDHDNLEKALAITDAKAVLAIAPVQFSIPVIDIAKLQSGGLTAGNLLTGEKILLMSSGTSDHVKVCEYNADAFRIMISDSYQIICQCPQIKKHYRGKLKLLVFLPFYHIFGLVAVYIWFAFFSRTFVLLNNMNPKTIVNTIRRHEVTHIFAVPLLWNTVYEQAMHMIRQRGDKTLKQFNTGMKIVSVVDKVPVVRTLAGKILFRTVRENLFGSSIRFLISGGSEIKPRVLRFFNAIGYHLANGYGMTEIGITSVELSNNPCILNSASVGKPFSSTAYRIGANGILEVRNSGMACRIHDGTGWIKTGADWFRTGDLAENRRGRWYILGRYDDLVISPNGENLNPNLVEESLRIKGIRELCLIGTETDNGMQPVLLVTPKNILSEEALIVLREELIQKIRSLGMEKQIPSIFFVKEALIGENEIKLNRTSIARKYREGAYTQLNLKSSSAEAQSELKEAIRALFAEALNKPAEDVGDQQDFFLECGGSSLDYFSLVSRLQEKYEAVFPMENGEMLTTVTAFADYLIRKTNADE